MFIVLLDEPGLFVFESAEEAVHNIEPIDAESEIRAAFDDAAVPYRVEWIKPNRMRKVLFGLFTLTSQGEYHLVPAGPPERAALVKLLTAHSNYTDPPEAEPDLRALLTRMRAV